MNKKPALVINMLLGGKMKKVGYWSNPNLITVDNVLYTRVHPIQLTAKEE